MAVATGTALLIAGIAAAGATVYTAVEQKKAAEKQEANYKKESKKAEDALKAQQKEESMSEFKADKVARQRQMVRNRQTQNRSGTLLTNPLAADTANTQTKTLLGS